MTELSVKISVTDVPEIKELVEAAWAMSDWLVANHPQWNSPDLFGGTGPRLGKALQALAKKGVYRG